MFKKFAFGILLFGFTLFLINGSLNLIFKSKKPYFPNRIYSYLRLCTGAVAQRLYGSSQDIDVRKIDRCDSPYLKVADGRKSFYFNNEVEIVASEILYSSDKNNFVINVSGRIKQDFFFFLWDKPIWRSFNGKEFVEGKSVLP